VTRQFNVPRTHAKPFFLSYEQPAPISCRVLPDLAEPLPAVLLLVCSPSSLVVLACLLGEMRLVRFLEKLIDPADLGGGRPLLGS